MVNILQVLKTAGTRLVTGQNPSMTQSQVKSTKTLFNALPVGKTVGVGKSIIQGGINIVKRATSNPFAGLTLKQGVTKIGANTAKLGISGLAAGTAFELSRSTASNTPFDIKRAATGTIYGISAGLSFPAAIIGTFSGGTQKAINTMAGQGGNILDVIRQSKPVPAQGMSKISDYDRTIGDLKNMFKSIPTASPVVNLTSGGYSAAPVNVSMPSPSYGFSPSVSAGGGMGEILPLMLLLAGGAGGIGYIAGKRKKKKYKRRKKRK